MNASLQRCLGLAPHFIDINAWYQECPKPRQRIHFWPVRSKGRSMITSYFGSDVCSLCQRKCQASGRARVVVCDDCQRDRVSSTQQASLMLNRVQRLAAAAAQECARCNSCFESMETFARAVDESSNTESIVTRGQAREGETLLLPLANCVCIDCPNTFRRHRLREHEVEAVCTNEVLNLL